MAMSRPRPRNATTVGGALVEVRFDAPQRGVSPGQSIVFYDGDLVVGGGVIARQPPEGT